MIINNQYGVCPMVYVWGGGWQSWSKNCYWCWALSACVTTHLPLPQLTSRLKKQSTSIYIFILYWSIIYHWLCLAPITGVLFRGGPKALFTCIFFIFCPSERDCPSEWDLWMNATNNTDNNIYCLLIHSEEIHTPSLPLTEFIHELISVFLHDKVTNLPMNVQHC